MTHGLSQILNTGLFYDESQFFGISGSGGVFYTAMSGTWNEPKIWRKVNHGGFHGVPGVGSVVLILHDVTVTNIVDIDRFFSKGATVSISGQMHVRKELRAYKVTGNGSLFLYGQKNEIIDKAGSDIRQVSYISDLNQDIIPITYHTLNISGKGTKYLLGDLLISYLINIRAPLELGAYDADINSFFQHFDDNPVLFENIKGSLSKQLGGTITFRNTSSSYWYKLAGKISLTGNPDVFVHSRLNLWDHYRGSEYFYTGTGTWHFLEDVTVAFSYANKNNIWDADILIYEGKELQMTGTCEIRKSINGKDAESKLETRWAGRIIYYPEQEPMQTGQVIISAENPNYFRYGGEDQDIKGIEYSHLEMYGTGTKKLLGDVVSRRTLSIQVQSLIDFNGYDLWQSYYFSCPVMQNQTVTIAYENATGLTVFWGDESRDNLTGSGTIQHTYIATGTYYVSVWGTMNNGRLQFPSEFNGIGLTRTIRTGLKSIEDITSLESAFENNLNLTTIQSASMFRDLNIQSFKNCFSGCANLKYNAPPLWDWFPSADGAGCFAGCVGLNNYDVIPANWK